MKYTVMVPCSNDKTGKKFDVGDVITGKEFTMKVIENWLTIGVLSEQDKPPLKLKEEEEEEEEELIN